MRVRTTTKFKDLKAKKLRKMGEEFDCTEERFEEIKKYVEPVQEEPVQEEPVQEEPDATAHEDEPVQDAPKKATKAKKGSK